MDSENIKHKAITYTALTAGSVGGFLLFKKVTNYFAKTPSNSFYVIAVSVSEGKERTQWDLHVDQRTKNLLAQYKHIAKVCLVGNFKRGKTTMGNYIFNQDFPVSGSYTPAFAIFVVPPDIAGVPLLVIDTFGRNSPVSVKEGELQIEQRRWLDDMITNVALRLSDVAIVVVEEMSLDELAFITKVQSMKEDHGSPGCKTVIVLHNYRSIGDKAEALSLFQRYVLEKFPIREVNAIIGLNKQNISIRYWVANLLSSTYPTFHLLTTRHGTEAGIWSNPITMSSIRYLLSSHIAYAKPITLDSFLLEFIDACNAEFGSLHEVFLDESKKNIIFKDKL